MTSQVFPLTTAAQKFAQTPALITPTHTLTYKQYHSLVTVTARHLQAAGVKAGDHLAIAGPHCSEYLLLLMALLRIGAVAVPVSTRWPRQQIASQLKDINCSDLLLPGKESAPGCLQYCSSQRGKSIINFKNQSSIESDEPDIYLEQDALIVFTSGSSGRSKAAMLTYENLYYNALGANRNIPFQPYDRWLLSLPLYHIGGLAILFRAILGGGAIIICEPFMTINQAVSRLNLTHLSLVTTQLYRLLQNKQAVKTLVNLKAILLGGSTLPASLIQQAINLGLPLFTTYGSTEMCSQITATSAGDAPGHLLTAGKILPYRQLKIADDNEILVKGLTLFKGYVSRDMVNIDLDQEGWFHTGDLGYLDDAGYLTVSGRKDNMFFSGGENIQPEEIEEKLCLFPGILQATVVPWKNKEYGARPVAFINMRGNKSIATQDIRAFLSQHLPRFKIPDYFLAWPEDEDNGLKPDRQNFIKLAEKYLS